MARSTIRISGPIPLETFLAERWSARKLGVDDPHYISNRLTPSYADSCPESRLTKTERPVLVKGHSAM